MPSPTNPQIAQRAHKTELRKEKSAARKTDQCVEFYAQKTNPDKNTKKQRRVQRATLREEKVRELEREEEFWAGLEELGTGIGEWRGSLGFWEFWGVRFCGLGACRICRWVCSGCACFKEVGFWFGDIWSLVYRRDFEINWKDVWILGNIILGNS